MRALVVAGLIGLCACTSPAQEAEQKYDIVKKSGRAADICAQGKAVVEAHLQAQDAEQYNTRRVETDIECQAALDDERLGIFRMPDGSKKRIEADDMSAPQ